MRTMLDIALHRWLVGFTIDGRPRDEGFKEIREIWTGLTLYVGPFAFGLWFKANHRFGTKEASQ